MGKERKEKIFYYLTLLVFLGILTINYAKRLFGKDLEKVYGNLLWTILFQIMGAFVIFGVYKQYDFFTEDIKYRFFKKIFGELGVRIFYYVLGTAIILLGIFWSTWIR